MLVRCKKTADRTGGLSAGFFRPAVGRFYSRFTKKSPTILNLVSPPAVFVFRSGAPFVRVNEASSHFPECEIVPCRAAKRAPLRPRCGGSENSGKWIPRDATYLNRFVAPPRNAEEKNLKKSGYRSLTAFGIRHALASSGRK